MPFRFGRMAFGEILSAFDFIESLFYSRQVEQTERQGC